MTVLSSPTSLSASESWYTSTLTYAALQISAAVRCGLMHATLTYCLSRPIGVRPNVWHKSAGRSRCIALNRRGVACGHRPEDSDRPAWKERSDQVAQRVSTWVSGALDQFDTAVMPRERGDIRDQTLMALSLAVLVLFSMQLFRVYAHLYNAAGFRPIREMMRR